MDYVNAFWVGGLICAFVQILLDRTKLMPGRIMVLLVCSGAVLGFFGIYEPFQKFAGAGASVPLLGFGNTLFCGVKEAVEKDGVIGIFTGGFKASAARNRSRADLWVSGILGIRATDEEIKTTLIHDQMSFFHE